MINKLIDRLENLNDIYHSVKIMELIEKMREWSEVHGIIFDHSGYKKKSPSIEDDNIFIKALHRFLELHKEVTESG